MGHFLTLAGLKAPPARKKGEPERPLVYLYEGEDFDEEESAQAEEPLPTKAKIRKAVHSNPNLAGSSAMHELAGVGEYKAPKGNDKKATPPKKQPAGRGPAKGGVGEGEAPPAAPETASASAPPAAPATAPTASGKEVSVRIRYRFIDFRSA